MAKKKNGPRKKGKEKWAKKKARAGFPARAFPRCEFELSYLVGWRLAGHSFCSCDNARSQRAKSQGARS
jgi:hypothetical protein